MPTCVRVSGALVLKRRSGLLKAMSELNCPMCSYIASHEKQLLRHVCQIHEHDPNFLIYCSKCSRSFAKLELFRKHKLRSSQCSKATFRTTPTSPGPSNDMSTTNYDMEESLASSVVPRGLSTKWQAATYTSWRSRRTIFSLGQRLTL